MQPYGNLSGGSGVKAYEIGRDFIRVQFVDDRIYRYSYTSAGRGRIEQMKRLAASGKGLSTYISQHVRDAYEH